MAQRKKSKRATASSERRETRELTHLDAAGRPRMVNVGDKPVSRREAKAAGALRMDRETLARLEAGRTPKGDPLVVAQIAGIQAAKRTADLIPLCHPLALRHVDVRFDIDPALPGVRVTAEASVDGPTGVEMEALTAAAVALLALYDMLKAIDRGMVIEQVALLEKRGGRSGDWVALRPPDLRT